MNIVEYLEQYKRADQKAKRLRREYEKEKSLIDAIKSPLGSDGMPHGSGISKSVENQAIRLADKLLSYEQAAIEAIEIRQIIFDSIMELDGVECEVLCEKYVYYFNEKTGRPKTWEDVADAVHISTRTVYAVRKRALRKIKCALFCSI